MENNQKKVNKRMNMLWLILIIVAWLFLQVYLLPKMGISTRLRSSCQLGDKGVNTEENHKKI